ncbi:MAG: hypothetical protein AAFU80_11120 [Pseudomonadota bacterium]
MAPEFHDAPIEPAPALPAPILHPNDGHDLDPVEIQAMPVEDFIFG